MKSILYYAVVVAMGISNGACAVELPYPKTERTDQMDEYHGIEVTDPYRWLEEDVRESDRVAQWVKAQNKVTFGYLETLPERAAIEQRLTQLWDFAKFGTPFKTGGRYYIAKNNGLQNHYVYYVSDTLNSEQRVLLNPNEWSEDGTVALGGLSFSDNGRYVAYGIQEAGSDWRTWKVRNIDTGKDLSDTLAYLKFTDVAWDPEAEGFFYAKYPDPDPNDQFQSLNKDMKVMYHRLGTSQSDDVVVYYRPDHPEWGYQIEVTDDGRYLVLTIWVGTDPKYRVMVKDLQQEYAMPKDVITTFDHEFSFIDNDGPVFYFRTDAKAPKSRIVAIDLRQPEPEHWQDILPESDALLEGANVVNNLLVCSYLKDVTTQVKLYTLKGQFLRDIALPGLGTASGFGGKRAYTETFYSFQSFAVPPSTYRYDMITGKSTLLERAEVDFDPDQYVTEQVFYRSKDGTSIPMFITHKKDLALNGANPTLLYGYGGFNISIAPSFSVSRLAWMEMGGVYAVANIRGGGEYGQAWHEAGKKQNKQNVFDDFIAAAEYLIDKKYTQTDKLAIMGGSNGGLLVGACMTQRPHLFGAAIPAVGVMDMLRFDEFTAGRFWTDDYGSAKDSPEMFEYLKGYSPYHNLKPGTAYPATLVTTADTDDRVVPGHSFKFAAQLQACHQGNTPVLIRIETKAGHGSGKPTAMIIEEQADIYAFLKQSLGM
ncbi:MAG: S9 family peptidase [Phycisphaeraceae bacterium]|nr:S9 family peptidase [Phycisphaeraceae bacterium]